jgi:hypothetical protein
MVSRILQAVNDLPPWAYTYQERPDDLLEIRAGELEAILRAVITLEPPAMRYDAEDSKFPEKGGQEANP